MKLRELHSCVVLRKPLICVANQKNGLHVAGIIRTGLAMVKGHVVQITNEGWTKSCAHHASYLLGKPVWAVL